jgi:nitrogen fixation NifU-like protein
MGSVHMDRSFDEWAKELQELILEEDRKIFSPRVMDHYLHPRHLKKISQPDGVASITGPCGDTMYVALRLENGRVAEIGFLTDGCGPTVACGSMIAQMALDKTPSRAAGIEQGDLLDALGGLPESHVHCAKLAVDTLQEALKNCAPEGSGSDAEK